MLKGTAAASGIGIGKCVLLETGRREVPCQRVFDVQHEADKLRAALDTFCGQLERVRELASQNFGQSEGGIITAQLIIVRDRDFLTESHAHITEKKENAQYAVSQVLEGYVRIFQAMDDALMRARAADFRDIRSRLLNILAGEGERTFEHLPEDSVIIARELYPSTLAALPVERVAAIVTAEGNIHSHTAILARTRRIPFVINAPGMTRAVCSGDELIVNGGTGEVIERPTSEEVIRYRERARQETLVRERQDEDRDKQTLTKDGRVVQISATLDTLSELTEAMDRGMDAAFLLQAGQVCGNARGEKQQFLAYRALLRGLRGKPAVIAAPQVKPSHEMPYMSRMDAEQLLLDEPELCTAFCALLRASAFGKVRIALPHVLSPTELRLARDLLERCGALLREREIEYDTQPELGAIIETPAAAICAGAIAEQADFLILGTDTLIGHTLATPTAAKKTAGSHGALHPAVLHLIYNTVQAAKIADKPVTISGETASDPMLQPFLIGCGVNGINVSPGALGAIKEQCANITHAYWAKRTPDILSITTPEEVAEYVKQNWAERTTGFDTFSAYEEVVGYFQQHSQDRRPNTHTNSP